jgi:hypothetical protein
MREREREEETEREGEGKRSKYNPRESLLKGNAPYS